MFRGPDPSLAYTLKNSFPDEVLPAGETPGLETRILWVCFKWNTVYPVQKGGIFLICNGLLDFLVKNNV